MKQKSLLLAIFFLFCLSCVKNEEKSLEELEGFNAEGLEELLAKTVSKSWRGEAFRPGRLGGTWHDVMTVEPKSFNHLIAEQDSNTSAVVRRLTDSLLDYDVIKREWVPQIASPQLIVDEANNTMQVVYTLRDDIFWSVYNSNEKVKVTSDDVIFWYDEIEGDPACQSSSYTGQFLIMPDGSEERITISKIDDRSFSFHFPRIIAEPLLTTNMDFGPRYIYEPAKSRGGADAVRNHLFTVAVDPKTIPSMGGWFLVEYTPSQRLVYKRNPDYWDKDSNRVSYPYIEEMIVRIIPEENTQLLLFKNGETETYNLRTEDLDDLIFKGDDSYTVFNSEGALSANFWVFNQNPVNRRKPQYEWFTKKEFRQAMSCLLNRDRINSSVYRGLAEPKLTLFSEPNAYYNPSITNRYLYDTQRALELLSSININRDRRGIMRDSRNRRIEFDLTIRSESSMNQDTALIIRDELSQVGIKVNIRILDFQKQVQQLFSSFDWDSMLMGLSGSNVFPSQGSNVWPSSGNLHMWHPNQETPATDWEARVDYLYNEGKFTLDKNLAQEIWDEFQSILIEQCPMIYLMRPRSFFAINNRWDFTNVYFDNLNGAETRYIFLRQ
ncbi:MAG: ABC transporter substrate-binding protein [Treponema sp.]|jgi:peptide/nickel transport system substrate-binding protein|nr:ABC transporter substrate-binding protein [Treponema sp.]